MLGIFRMGQKYYAFYWTFPVPRVGFRTLPAGVDAAAAASKTIRYCRDRVRSYVRARGGTLSPEDEISTIELKPDRGSRTIALEFAALLRRAHREGSLVAIVDFSAHRSWRGHQYLEKFYCHPACAVIKVSADDAERSGFSPYLHFQGWREEERQKRNGKSEHRAHIVRALLETNEQTSHGRAMFLNANGFRTHGGREWTGDNLRKFLKLEKPQ